MSSYPWNVCRTCLSVQNIYPIFNMREHHEKYTDVILTTTGVKVELNDNLPQQMCLFCITFINDSVKFRKKCEDSNMELLSRLIDKQTEAIKVETSPEFKTENDKSVTIDITHLLPDLDEDFKDYDDNITLDSLQCNNSVEKTCIAVEFDGQDKNSTEKPVLLEENNEQTEVEKPKRKLRSSKKENVGVKKKAKAKEEKVREEVECEYCHKILTSRLSLRNHYKIHTGFDVVCEHCGKKFITRRLLLMHCRAKHGYEKTDKCSYCDYRASNAEQVKIHERLHTGEKPYVCAECGAGFHRKSSYLQHVAIHLPEKTVQCEQCPARFKSATLMRIHSHRHRAPAYSFHCRLCGNMFARRRNVARHLQRVHAAPPDPHIDRRRIAHNIN